MEKKKPATIDEYIASFPPEVQRMLQSLRAVIHETVPETKEAISYQMPTFKFKGRNLVHFAAYQNHIGFYPNPSAIERFADELTPYKTSKGAIQFPIDERLPLDLIKRIIAYRVKENTAS